MLSLWHGHVFTIKGPDDSKHVSVEYGARLGIRLLEPLQLWVLSGKPGITAHQT